jgi:N-acetylglucosamine-6-phosphate deacetylase
MNATQWSGLFDFQVNGFAGVDFQQDGLTLPQARQVTARLQQHGTSRIFVTLITDAVDRLCRRLENFERLRSADPVVARAFAGYHLEGPWLSPEPGYRGAHPGALMKAPSAAEFQRLQSAATGRIRLVTLAPEWAGSPEFIEGLRDAGVHVSLGHTNASAAEISAAIEAGARFCTHLGNAVPAVLPRHDNIIQRLLARDELTACFIPDGWHLPPAVLRNYYRAKSPRQVLFTTDAMAGASAGPGNYTLGGLTVAVGADGVARDPVSGGFAGSTLTADEGVRRVASYLNLSSAEAHRLWSAAPLAAFGLEPETAV